jgi:hypothetical protein
MYVPGFMTDFLNEIKKLSLHVLLICYMHIYVCFNAMISKVIFISGILDCKRHVWTSINRDLNTLIYLNVCKHINAVHLENKVYFKK